MLTTSTQLQNKSFHVIERTRTSSKCQKVKNARAKRAKRAKILFFIVKYANLWGFCCLRRRGCLSALLTLACGQPGWISLKGLSEWEFHLSTGTGLHNFEKNTKRYNLYLKRFLVDVSISVMGYFVALKFSKLFSIVVTYKHRLQTLSFPCVNCSNKSY